ncbi:Fis family transcriptional regulator [Corynebacterium amycolatum]|nr:Fis family transcriptional regulator [Corynebacterium amycolatum]
MKSGVRKMVRENATGDSRESEAELRPDSSEHLGLAGDTSGIEPVLAQKMLNFEKEWLKVARRGPRMAGARQEAIRRRFAEEFDNNTIRYHQVLSRLLDSPAAEAAEPVLVHRLRAVRDNQSS